MTIDQALRRWQLGHHLFFIQIQGIVINHRKLLKVLNTGDTEQARKIFRRATQLLNSSATAMQFAANMPEEHYNVIRQSMSPPNVAKGFSGLWSIDHRTMMDELKNLKNQVNTINSCLTDEHQNWVKAMDNVYRTHSLVCERFVGDGPSLAMGSNRLEYEKSAVQNLESFRQRAFLLTDSLRHK